MKIILTQDQANHLRDLLFKLTDHSLTTDRDEDLIKVITNQSADWSIDQPFKKLPSAYSKLTEEQQQEVYDIMVDGNEDDWAEAMLDEMSQDEIEEVLQSIEEE